MQEDRTASNQWRNLITELRACDDETQNPWGDVDEFLVARFLAGECNEEEREAIRRARQEYPKLDEYIVLAIGTLSDLCAFPGNRLDGKGLEDVKSTTLPGSVTGLRGGRSWRRVLTGAVPNWAVAAVLVFVIGLAWALQARLSSVKSQVVTLSSERELLLRSNGATSDNSELRSLRTELQDLSSRIAQVSQRPIGVATPVAEPRENTQEVRGNGEVVIAVRGFAGLGRQVSYQATRSVSQVVTNDQGTVTVIRPDFGGSVFEEPGRLPRNSVDSAPVLPPDQLFPALAHEMDLVRWAAADALSRIATADLKAKARRAIVEALKKRRDNGRMAAEFLVNGSVQEGFGEDLSKQACDALSSPDEIVRWAGLHFFLVRKRCFEDKNVTTVSSGVIEPELIGKLAEIARKGDHNKSLHKATIYLLGQFGKEALSAVMDLAKVLETDSDALVRRWAAYAIGQVGPEAKAVAPRLGEMISASPSIKDQAYRDLVFPAIAYAYGELCRGDGQTNLTRGPTTVLEECLTDVNPNVAYWAAFALLRLNGPASIAPLSAPTPINSPPTKEQPATPTADTRPSLVPVKPGTGDIRLTKGMQTGP